VNRLNSIGGRKNKRRGLVIELLPRLQTTQSKTQIYGKAAEHLLEIEERIPKTGAARIQQSR
jgi:hypothetical protein